MSCRYKVVITDKDNVEHEYKPADPQSGGSCIAQSDGLYIVFTHQPMGSDQVAYMQAQAKLIGRKLYFYPECPLGDVYIAIEASNFSCNKAYWMNGDGNFDNELDHIHCQSYGTTAHNNTDRQKKHWSVDGSGRYVMVEQNT